jgi:hypothetical protein
MRIPQCCARTLRPFGPPSQMRSMRNPNPCLRNLVGNPIIPSTTRGKGCSVHHRSSLRTVRRRTRSIYYALGIPLGDLDESCIDWDVIDAIMFMPSRPLPGSSTSRGGFRIIVIVIVAVALTRAASPVHFADTRSR